MLMAASLKLMVSHVRSHPRGAVDGSVRRQRADTLALLRRDVLVSVEAFGPAAYVAMAAPLLIHECVCHVRRLQYQE